jgi:hypothetical protein
MNSRVMASDLTSTARGDEDKNIPRPPRHQEAVDTFTTVASNLSELAQVSHRLQIDLF